METLEVNQLTKTPTKKTLTAGWVGLYLRDVKIQTLIR